jgi:hypothetical protein
MNEMASNPLSALAESARGVVLTRYADAIRYYWRGSKFNKRAYKWSRYWMIFLGAFVTLMAALTSSTWIPKEGFWRALFEIGTPIVAFMLTILGGFSQAFQWGATWRDSVITAERLEQERDRILVTADEKMDAEKELATLNGLILQESRGFFDRVLGRSRVSDDGQGAGSVAVGSEEPALSGT